jgi:hypothetical protein
VNQRQGIRKQLIARQRFSGHAGHTREAVLQQFGQLGQRVGIGIRR